MPTLNWIGKDKVVSHHLEVPYRVLEHKYGFRSDDENDKSETHSGNKIIHGDNLEALKSLMPEYEGKIDCVYIDPPYNTGEEKWIYNDNINDPHILKWLGEVVGKEGDDLTRHDKWACMMYPRLQLISKLLSFDGVIAISIGFHELHSLYQLCREIFPTKQTVTITVQTSGGKPKEGFNYVQEYIVFVAPKGFSPNPSLDAMNEYASPYHGMNLAGFNQITRPNQVYPIYIDKETGVMKGVGKSLQELIDEGLYTGEKSDFEFDYSAPEGQVAVYPVTNKGDKCVWRLTSDSFKKDWEKGYIKISPQTCKNNKNLFSVKYLADGIKQKIEAGEVKTYRISEREDIPTVEIEEFKTGGVNISTIWTNKLYYTTRGSNELTSIFGEKGKFPYPKPMQLVKDIIQRISKKDSIILDSFGGSGTTAHAVLSLNAEDEGNRNFILIEMMDYAETITAERVRRVTSGYKFHGEVTEDIFSVRLTPKNILKASDLLEDANKAIEEKKSEYIKVGKPKIKDDCLKVEGTKLYTEVMEGIDGEFDFYELGDTIFDKEGCLNTEIDESKIREYIFYTETCSHLTREHSDISKYLLDTVDGVGYYFYYEKEGYTTLSKSTLGKVVTEKAEQYIIYANCCTLSKETLAKYNIVFKKIPGEIKRF